MKVEVYHKYPNKKINFNVDIPSKPLDPGFYNIRSQKLSEIEFLIKAERASLSKAFFKNIESVKLDYSSLFYRYSNEADNINITVMGETHADTEVTLRALAYYVETVLKLPIIFFKASNAAEWIINYPYDLCIFQTSENNFNENKFIDEYSNSKRVVLERCLVTASENITNFHLMRSDFYNVISNIEYSHSFNLIVPTKALNIVLGESGDNPYYKYTQRAILDSKSRIEEYLSSIENSLKMTKEKNNLMKSKFQDYISMYKGDADRIKQKYDEIIKFNSIIQEDSTYAQWFKDELEDLFINNIDNSSIVKERINQLVEIFSLLKYPQAAFFICKEIKDNWNNLDKIIKKYKNNPELINEQDYTKLLHIQDDELVHMQDDFVIKKKANKKVEEVGETLKDFGMLLISILKLFE